jgi:hypothetical protein
MREWYKYENEIKKNSLPPSPTGKSKKGLGVDDV